ncbi:MAG: hypothetical protein GY865_01565 [candidate division Zixibacteria bacterium]|nr:hypothetical protein [candidate division Zixibacteria bacterium]
MRSGDIVEFESNTIIGTIIRWFAPCNHTALVIAPIDYKKTHERRVIMEAVGKGVVKVPLSDTLKGFKGKAYLLRLKPEHDKHRESITKWALKQEGISYDYSSLFLNLICRVSQNANDFFCSEFAQMAMAHVGLIDSKIKAVRPGEFGQFGIFKDPIRIM